MWALITYDLNSAAPNASQILSGVVGILGSRGRSQLLGRCWLVQVGSEDDFDALGAGLESLHAANPAAFDYFALGYHSEGGPVRWSPSRRSAHPIPGSNAS